MTESNELYFEYTLRMFLGETAFGFAGRAHSESARRDCYKKIFKNIVKQVQQIETNTTHKEGLARTSEYCLGLLKHPYNEMKFTLSLLRFIYALLGYECVVRDRPYRIATPAYFQKEGHNFMERLSIDDQSLPNDHEENTVTLKRRLMNQLKDEGKTTFEISLVFGVSEYQVKKLLSGH